MRIRTAADLQIGAVNVIEVLLDPTYRPETVTVLNEFGTVEKPLYRTADVARIFRITPSALQWRFRKGWYPETCKDGAGRRIFAKEDITKLIATKLPPSLNALTGTNSLTFENKPNSSTNTSVLYSRISIEALKSLRE